jgi:hypothetical protein
MVQKLKQSSLRFQSRFERKHRENMRFWIFHARQVRRLKLIAFAWRGHLELGFPSLLGFAASRVATAAMAID